MNTKKGNRTIAFSRNTIFLFSDFQRLDNCAISLNIFLFEIIKQFPPLSYKLEQGSLRAVIFFIGQQVLGQVIDPGGKNCNLAFS